MGQILPFHPYDPDDPSNPDFRDSSDHELLPEEQMFRNHIERGYTFSARRALARAEQAQVKMDACQEFRDLLDSYSLPIITLATVAVFTMAMSFRMEAMLGVYVASHIGVVQSLIDGAIGGLLPALLTFIVGIFINGALHEGAQRRYHCAIDEVKIPAEDRFQQLTGMRAPTYNAEERQLSRIRQSVKGDREIQLSTISRAKHLRRNIRHQK